MFIKKALTRSFIRLMTGDRLLRAAARTAVTRPPRSLSSAQNAGENYNDFHKTGNT
jgi:hypothetical protein